MLKNYTLLITGCIAPNPAVPFLEMKNAEDRRRQYIESIQFYIQKTNIKRIVYCDNSSASAPMEITALANNHSKDFEWLSFRGDNEKAVTHGKGYGEGEIIRYALSHSTLLENTDYFIKVTGRVIVKNIDLLTSFMSTNRMYFCRNTSTNVDTKIYGLPIQTYKKEFLNLYNEVDDKNGRYLENLFSDRILKEQLTAYNFIVYPNVHGVSGSTGKSYTLPLKTRIKLTLKSHLKR